MRRRDRPAVWPAAGVAEGPDRVKPAWRVAAVFATCFLPSEAGRDGMFGQVLGILKTSRWTFRTSGTGGLGLEFFAAVGGELVVNPPTGDAEGFYYGAAGLGLGLGVKKIPKIGKIVDRRGFSEKGGGNLAPKSFWNHGIVYIMEGFRGDDLTTEDFRGVCLSSTWAAAC